MSRLEDCFIFHANAMKLPHYEREYRFAAHHVGLGKGIRQRLKDADMQDWRYDFFFPDSKLAVEINGGNWVQGRHTRADALQSEYRKEYASDVCGHVLIKFDGEMVKSGEAIQRTKQMIDLIESERGK